MKSLLGFLVVFVCVLFSFSSASYAGWESLNPPFNGGIRALALIGTDMYVGGAWPRGLYVSHDNGVSWDSLGFSAGNYQVRAIAGSGTNLLVGLDYSEGAYLSTDNGVSWTRTIVTSTSVYAFFVEGETVFAGCDSGLVFRSTDNGASWMASSIDASNCLVNSFTRMGNSIFAGTYPQAYTVGPGLICSTDDGVTWEHAPMIGMGFSDISGVLASGNNLIVTAGNGIFVSTDSGSSCSRVWNDQMQGTGTLSGLIEGDGKVFALALGGGMMPMSANHGLNWVFINQQTPALHGQHAFAISGGNLFAASSMDDGSIWRCPLSELYVCGDANGDAVRDISDCVFIIAFIFSSGSAPAPQRLGDANNDGTVDISDAVYLIAYTFSGGPEPCHVSW